MIKVFTLNENGKIELTKEELDKLISDVWHDGFENGKTSTYLVYPYSYPIGRGWYYLPTCADKTYTVEWSYTPTVTDIIHET